MDFQNLCKKVTENAMTYGMRYGVTIDKDFLFMKLIEEFGEFSQALLIMEGRSRPEKFIEETLAKEEVAKELADVVGMSITLAHVLEIDLEAALHKKWIKD